jgi:tetratricopeptide (TPR) repeat protein
MNASATLDEAFFRLYNCDFAGSQKLARSYTEAAPGDPVGHAARAASFLFSELHRLNLLGKEFMTSDDRIKSKDKILAKEVAQVEFQKSAGEARRLALAALQANPSDVNALLAMTLTAGMERDFAALVEKRLRASLDFAKESQQYARRLIEADPTQYDAYFTFGFSEYLVGSLPFFARWFMKLDGVIGDKAKGLQELETAAERGRFLKPFARMMLAMFYLREKRPEDSRRHLQELARTFPDNPAVRSELSKIPPAPSE